jgi:hypothetical protein
MYTLADRVLSSGSRHEVVSCLCLIKHYSFKTYGVAEIKLRAVLLSPVLLGDEWPASRPGRFTSEVRVPL